MKKTIVAFGAIFGLLSFFVTPISPVTAIDLGIGSAQKAAKEAGYDAEGTTETTLAQNIGAVIRAVLTISGVIFTALIFYAGYLWMTARGDEGNVEKAKNIIETSIIGLVIALASFGITNFVMKNIAAKTTPAPTVPAEIPDEE